MAQFDGSRTVSYRWYDSFNVPFGEWWDYRLPIYGIDVPLTDTFPYIYRHYYNATMFDTYSSARLSITGRNMTELNMAERPEFLPFLSGQDGPRGGCAKIDWYLQYVTEADWYDHEYPVPITSGYLDGYACILNGTVTLDREAAMAVLGVTAEEWDSFEDWWTANEAAVTTAYVDWMEREAGPERLDIWPMYDWNLAVIVHRLDAARAGDDLVLSYDFCGWGFEALMTRWLHEAFMPTEWWFEGMDFQAEIGPESADLDIDTAVEYALSSWDTKDSDAPCWVWQGILQDTAPSNSVHLISEFDPYEDLQHVTHSPGCTYHGEMVDYRCVPGSFNLSEGETLAVEWPEADLLFLEHVSAGVTNNITSPAEVVYMEPMPSEMSGRVYVDPENSTVVFDGPIDFWAWSREQDVHVNLSAEWDRLGVLPWGMPYIELSMPDGNAAPFACLRATHHPDANISTEYLLDASLSSDPEDERWELQFRWDLDGDGSWDLDWGAASQLIQEYEGVGEYAVAVEVMDTDGATDLSRVEISITDIEPPTTTAAFDGEEGTNGWYVSAVSVSLTVEDGNAVAGTWYRLDGGNWTTYADEMEVDSDGLHTLEYYSVDCECNCESVCSEDFKLDTTAPMAIIVTSSELHLTDNVTVFWACTDATSGVSRSELSLDGQRFISFGSAISNTFMGLTEGSHTVELRVYDKAGNTASDTYTFTVSLTGDEDGILDPTDEETMLLYVAVAIVAGIVATSVGILVLRRKG